MLLTLFGVFFHDQLACCLKQADQRGCSSVQGDRVRDIMEEVQPVPIRIKLVPQLEGSYLDEAGKKRLAEQLGPGAVAIIQKYVQVGAREGRGGGG